MQKALVLGVIALGLVLSGCLEKIPEKQNNVPVVQDYTQNNNEIQDNLCKLETVGIYSFTTIHKSKLDGNVFEPKSIEECKEQMEKEWEQGYIISPCVVVYEGNEEYENTITVLENLDTWDCKGAFPFDSNTTMERVYSLLQGAKYKQNEICFINDVNGFYFEIYKCV